LGVYESQWVYSRNRMMHAEGRATAHVSIDDRARSSSDGRRWRMIDVRIACGHAEQTIDQRCDRNRQR